MPSTEEKKHVWESVAVITFVALVVRLAFIHALYHVSYNDVPDHLYFGFEIGRIARSIASGHGYGNPLAVPTGPTAWTTPVYPYLLAGVFKLFGIFTRASVFLALGLNGLFSALVCLPLYFIARRSFGRGVAVLACWMWALMPFSIYLASGFVWDTCITTLLLTLLFLCTLRLKDHPGTNWAWLGFGAFWGFAALTNPVVLSLGPFFTLWAIAPLWRNRKKWLASAALVLFGLLIVLAPWQVRNYRTFQKFIPLRDTFGLELWSGNDGQTASVADLSVHPTTSKPALEEFLRLGETAFMHRKLHQGLDFISRHPGFFLAMSLRRFAYFWTDIWCFSPQGLQWELHGPCGVFFVVPLTLLMIFGLVLARRVGRSTFPLFGFLLGIFPIVFYVTHPVSRYRNVMDPEILILAALSLRYLYDWARAAWTPSA